MRFVRFHCHVYIIKYLALPNTTLIVVACESNHLIYIGQLEDNNNKYMMR